jgi:AcrR family transcriptional regulator
MPRLWAETIDSHRRQLSDAVLDAAAALVAESGPLSVSMSAVAQRAGIGRATLYKYFPDVESIVLAWHQRAFSHRLAVLQALAQQPDLTLDDLVAFGVHQRHHLRQHTEANAIGAVAEALAAPPTAMPDVIADSVADSLAAVITELAHRREVRRDVEPAALARWTLYVVHAPASIDDDTWATLVRSSLTGSPATSPRPRHRTRTAT